MCPCLIDASSDTMLVFRLEERQGEWIVEVKGNEQLWERVVQAYSWWVDTGDADINEYRLDIDAFGEQRVILASKDEEYEHTWMLP